FEPLVMWIGYRRGRGAASKFVRPGEKKIPYHQANGRFIWVRFGARRGDTGLEPNPNADKRYSDYMAGRMAWVHSLGAVWFVGTASWVVAQGFPNSAVSSVCWKWDIGFWVAVATLAAAWYWQGLNSMAADESHYQDVGEGS
ncbi:MAG: hypothetical protein O3B65_06080, partial [Chloroflexi bacterium]|nr:hypothetical protein [Chloroflexota bacterium]